MGKKPKPSSLKEKASLARLAAAGEKGPLPARHSRAAADHGGFHRSGADVGPSPSSHHHAGGKQAAKPALSHHLPGLTRGAHPQTRVNIKRNYEALTTRTRGDSGLRLSSLAPTSSSSRRQAEPPFQISCSEWPGSLRSRFTSGSPTLRESVSTSLPRSLMSSAKDRSQYESGDWRGRGPFSRPSRVEEPARASPSRTPTQQNFPWGRGGTFVQQCWGQGREVTKLKEKGVIR